MNKIKKAELEKLFNRSILSLVDLSNFLYDNNYRNRSEDIDKILEHLKLHRQDFFET